MWFSTASTMTWCCLLGSGTCILLAFPIAGWGMSPSPPISFEVSTMTTRLFSSSARTLAISRTTVVFPTPGLPSSNMEQGFSASSRSLIISTWPVTALPTLHVRPTTPPVLFLMALMRCSVPAMPALLSPPKAPTLSMAASRSSEVITSSRRISSQSAPRNLALGLLPKSITISSRLALSGWLASGSRRSEGKTSRMVSRSSRTKTDPSCSGMQWSSSSPQRASAPTLQYLPRPRPGTCQATREGHPVLLASEAERARASEAKALGAPPVLPATFIPASFVITVHAQTNGPKNKQTNNPPTRRVYSPFSLFPRESVCLRSFPGGRRRKRPGVRLPR
mmetsp:Transcript_43/g.147  ORF Transcript_43/g.147 Transcript_43/m.147 type:complete len:336 (+) Transcript_43:755-1762(+)